MKNNIITDIPSKLTLIQEKLCQLKIAGKFEIQNGDEGYSTAPSNIALIKYWGKNLNRKQIPDNSSLSYTLGGFRSFTKVTTQGRFLPETNEKTISIKNKLFLNNKDIEVPIPEKMDILIRSIFNNFADEITLKIESINNFPTACGIASSASGYAALVGAIADLLQLKKHLRTEELHIWLTEWARLGSGSATRSAIQSSEESFIKWELENNSNENFTETSEMIFHPKWKQVEHCVFVLNENEKKISSSDGHKSASTSPFHNIRVAGVTKKIARMTKALKEFDFETVQQISEEDAFAMHAVMQTGNPKACYLDEETSKAIALFIQMRDINEILAFWTLDAGPNIHILFYKDAKEILRDYHAKLQELLNREIKVFKNVYRGGLLIGKNEYYNILDKELLKSSLN
ncbi:diphosphomevalonate decarboxylase [Fluviispira vulneris]|uniref:diphosphomevalonate decarboxylase n=1 Tax=Fluviispira vulneris TaxID=2763012 RepID=UPI001648A0EA|nr:diphosphomevalonate decarboxylase [Fluviispira vulneris]